MKDYKPQLDQYLDFPDHKKQVEIYLKKYWLDKTELNDIWIPIKNKVYSPKFKAIPDIVYNANFDHFIQKGGVVFGREDFNLFMSCIKVIGDKQFVILEDYDDANPPHTAGPALRFRYPTTITWEEIRSGADISDQTFKWPARNWFVFGDSGQWGKYTGSDYKYPLDIIGFTRKYSSLFTRKLVIPKEDIADLKVWTAFYGIKLPGVY
jgi:hypothetical protein